MSLRYVRRRSNRTAGAPANSSSEYPLHSQLMHGRLSFVSIGLTFANALLFCPGCDISKVSELGPVSSFDVQPLEKAISYDFGTMFTGEKVDHRFIITNDSAIEWKVERVESNCGCVVTDVRPRVIPAGAEAAVDVCYTAGADSADVRKRVLVNFSSSDAPVVELFLTGRVRKPIATEPGQIYIKTANVGQSISTSFVVKNFQNDECRLPTISCGEPWLSTTITENPTSDTSARQMWNVAVNVNTSGLTFGAQHAVLHISAENRRTGEVRKAQLPFIVSVKPEVEAVPASVFFGNVPASSRALVIRRVVLRFNDQAETAAFDDFVFRTDLENRCTLRALRHGPRCLILEIGFVPQNKENDVESSTTAEVVKGTISVLNRQSGFPVIEIPVVGMVN